MQKVNVLVIDDNPKDRSEELGCVESILGKDNVRPSLRSSIYDVPRLQEFDADIAILDILFEDEFGHRLLKTGIDEARRLADSPGRLVILKSTLLHKDQAPDERRHIEEEFSSESGVKLALGTDWASEIKKHVRRWVREGQLRARRHEQYQLVHLSLQDRTEVLRQYETLAQIIPDGWLRPRPEAALETSLALLQALSRMLRQGAQLGQPGEVRWAQPYCRAGFDPDQPFVPWEAIFFDKWPLDCPLVRTLDVAPPTAKGGFSKLLFVHGPGVKSQAELGTIKQAVKPFGLTVEEVSFDDFMGAHHGHVVDIVHVAMHGPSGPSDAAEPRFVDGLKEAIDACKPCLLVMQACNSLHLFRGQARGYPHTVAPLTELLHQGRLEVFVGTQFLLAEETVGLWARTFYPQLLTFLDVGIAAGSARKAVATQTQMLFELATVVVARKKSSFIRQGDG